MLVRFLLGLGLALVAVIAALVFGPGQVDWNQERGRIEALLSEALGRPVSIDGPIAVSLLPSPELTVGDISVSGETRSGQIMVARELKAELAFGSLLSGELRVERVALDQPILRIPRSGARGLPGDERGVRLVVEDGVVILENADGGAALRFSRVSGEFDQDPGQAARLRVETELAGRRLRLEGTIGEAAEAADRLVSLSAELPDVNGTARFSGKLVWTLGAPSLAGRLRVEAPEIALLPPWLGLPGETVLPSAPLRLEGLVSVAGESAALNDAELAIGDLTATGAVVADLRRRPAVDVVMSLPRLDLASPRFKSGGEVLDALLDWTQSGARLRLEATVQILALGEGFARQLVLIAQAAGGALDVERLEASLPGASTLSASARLVPRDAGTGIDGRMELRSEHVGALWNWLGLRPLDLLPPRMELAGKLTGTLAEPVLRDAVLGIPAGRLAGGVAYSGGPKPTLRVEAAGDSFTVTRGLTQGLAGLPPLVDGLSIALNLGLDRVTIAGRSLADLRLEGVLEGSRLEMSRLVFSNFSGIAFDGAGTVSTASPPSLALRGKARTERLGPALRAVNPAIVTPSALADSAAAIDGALTWSPSGWTLRGEAGSGRATATLDLADSGAGPSGTAVLRHPDGVAALSPIMPAPVLAAIEATGPLEANLALRRADPPRLEVKASLGKASAEAELTILAGDEAGPAVEGSLRLAGMNLLPLLRGLSPGAGRASGRDVGLPGVASADLTVRAEAMRLAGLTLPEATARLTQEPDQLALTGISATLLGGRLSGEIRLRGGGVTAAELDLALTGVDLRDIGDGLTGRLSASLGGRASIGAGGVLAGLDGEGEFTMTGLAPLPQTEGPRKLFHAVAGAVDQLGVDRPVTIAGPVAILAGALDLASLKLDLPGLAATLRGVADLPGGRIDARLRAQDGERTVGTVSLTGPFDAVTTRLTPEQAAEARPADAPAVEAPENPGSGQ